MTQQGLPVSKLISVSVTLTPTAAQGANLNSCMIVGDSNVIDVTERYRSYADIEEVATDFGTTAPEYLAALLFFSQNPQPQQLYIGRWAEAATSGELIGGPVTAANQVPSAWTGITTGAFFIEINGLPYAIASLNFASISNLNGVASVIQTALNSALSGTTCVWNSTYENFEITSPTTGATSTVSFAAPPTAFGFIEFTGVPSNADTVTVDGSSIEFVTSGATGLQVNIGTQSATQAALLALLQSSADTNIAKMTYFSSGAYIYCVAKVTGTAGNAYTLTASSSAITLSGAELVGGAGVDISTMMACTSAPTDGAYLANGIAAETAVAAVAILDAMNVSWYALAFAAGTNNADLTDSAAVAVAAYIQAASNKHIFGTTTSEGVAITSNDTSSLGYLLKQANYSRSFCQWSSQNAYAAVSLLGKGCTVDFDGSDTTLNFQWQQEPGVVAENLTLGQSQNLDANYYSYYANFANDTAVIVNGYTASGNYIDEIWNSDWFANRIQTDLYNVLYTAGTKIPQTDAGMHILATTIQSSCDAAVNNGFLGPGVWNSAGFGAIVEGQFLDKGYYIYQPPISSQSQSARAARQSVAFQVAAKEAGAVNDVSVSVVVNQ